ncbi:hypothetical protein PIB30_048013 [Stylosanthes scabra]|uniref:Uncharacterized protein n=1 Tax=Stylosanthes scabra TaxID=79078 RepID=A0ABU6WF07_9FABA|nr:hypothetical protein [Stylosanthes scabra]
MVTAPAKGNAVAAVADDIRGRGSELREKHELMERTTVVMDAIVAGNSISVVGVAKEREIEIEREDRRERNAMGRGRRFSCRCNSEWLPFLRRNSTATPPPSSHRHRVLPWKEYLGQPPSSVLKPRIQVMQNPVTRTHRCHCMSCHAIAVWWFFLLTITDLSPIRVYQVC